MRRKPSFAVPASPPACFPLYGLDGSWPGARWLDSFGDALGDVVRWIRLAHWTRLAPPGRETGELIMVETHSRPLTDAEEARGGEAALRSLASSAAFTLVNLTLPDASVPRPEGLVRALVDHAEEQGKRHAEWLPVTWQVDGLPVPARAWEFAGGWAAFSDGLDEVYLAASGCGARPDGLALTRLRDARAYHFDLAQPLDTRAVTASSAAAWADDADGQPAWRPADWHPGQLRLRS